jgi:hypothetical protein
MAIKRREFLASAGAALTSTKVLGSSAFTAAHHRASDNGGLNESGTLSSAIKANPYLDRVYQAHELQQIAFPMGGMGTGTVFLEGNGSLGQISLHNEPILRTAYNLFAALGIKGAPNSARVLEGQLPRWKLRAELGGDDSTGVGWYGLPRFADCSFDARFPFGIVRINDVAVPVSATIKGWSPFAPGDRDSSSLPVAALEYSLRNTSSTPVEGVFSFNAENFLSGDLYDPRSTSRITGVPGGFCLYGDGSQLDTEGGIGVGDQAFFAAWVDDPNVQICYSWPYSYYDGLWQLIAAAKCLSTSVLTGAPSRGATLFVPISLAPGEIVSITVKLAWYVQPKDRDLPQIGIVEKSDALPRVSSYRPWYLGRFDGIQDLIEYWNASYPALLRKTAKFSNALFESTLPSEALEAVASNLSILKSYTVRRHIDGKMWLLESTMGKKAMNGAPGYGSPQAMCSIAELFPDFERQWLDSQFFDCQAANGASIGATLNPSRRLTEAERRALPLRAPNLVPVIGAYHSWRTTGDMNSIRKWWPQIESRLEHCIRTFDPDESGWIVEPSENTYDTVFWGPDSLMTGFYLTALNATIEIGRALNRPVTRYETLLARGTKRMENQLFNGEYFHQIVEWRKLRTAFPPDDVTKREIGLSFITEYSPYELMVARTEGPKWQYGTGCLSGALEGVWCAWLNGMAEILDRRKVEAHLLAVHKYNFKKNLTDHANIWRPQYAIGDEGGLLLCTWPKNDTPKLPFLYSGEVWTGIEYIVASHLASMGHADKACDIIKACRARYDGTVRNPFDEFEAGHWYSRAMASYALLQAFSGARYDAVAKILYLRPRIKGDFRCFISTATGYGIVGVKRGRPFLSVSDGIIPCSKIDYISA